MGENVPMTLRERFRESLRHAVRAEQARLQQRIISEVARLGGVPGLPLVVVDGKLTEHAEGRLRP
jgi:hypothetical protein